MLIELFLPLYVASVAILLLVLRAGASRVFFDVVGSFQAERLIADAKAKVGVFEGLMLDGLTGITESAALLDEQLQQVVDTTVPLARNIAEARIEFEKFANFANASQVESDIIAFGESIGFTADQALNAGSRMAQLSGVLGGGATVGTATEMGITFGLIGGMETQESMTRLINLQQQTGFMQGELTDSQFNLMSAEKQANVVRQNTISLLDSLNTVENRSSATMQQITFVMNQFASSAQLAGDSIHFMAGASATLIEAGEEQGKAGRALRMMYARLGANTGENAEILAKYNIAVKDSNGELRSMEAILGDVAKSRIMDSDAEKMRVAQAIAGNDHYVRAIKLMEGYDRAMQLTTESSQGLDSATEELNRRLEDEAVQLQLAEARLENMRAKLGDALIPTVTRATRGQALFNMALADFVSTPVGDAMASFMFTVQQYARTFAPFGEAFLNIMSLNVALRTQETIMRGLSGVEIARASAYGMKNQQETTSLNNLRQELNIQDQLSMKRIQEIQLSKMKMKALKEIRMIAELGHLKDFQALEAEEQKMQKRYNAEIAKLREVSILNSQISSEDFKRLKTAHDEYGTLQKTATTKHQMLVLAQSEQGYRTKGLSDEQRVTRLLNNKLFLRNNEKKAIEAKNAILDKMAMHEQTILQFRNATNVLAMQGVRIKQMEDGQYKLEIINQEQVQMGHVEAINAIRQKKLELLQYTLQVMQTNKVTGTANQFEVMILNAAAAATAKLGQEHMKKANHQQVANVVSEEASRVALKLSTMLGIESDVLQRIIMQLPIFAQHVEKAKAAEDAMAAASMRNSQRLMMLNGALGITSMGLSMFSTFTKDADKQADLMQASMVSMGLAMGVSTLQMGAMGFSMAKMTTQMGGATTGAVAMTAAVQQTQRAMTLLKFTAGGLVVGGLIYGLTQLIPNANTATDEIDDLNASVNQLYDSSTKFTQEQYEGFLVGIDNELLNPEATISGKKTYDDDTSRTMLAISELQNMMVEQEILEERIAVSRNEAIKSVTSARLGALEQEMAMMDRYAIEQIKADRDAGRFHDRRVALAIEQANVARTTSNRHRKYYAEAYVFDMFGEGTMMADLILASTSLADFNTNLDNLLADMATADMGGFDTTLTDNVIGPIEAAKQAMFEFGNEREELFFGMKAGNVTGDMLKQVVNKGVETLINTTELIMNNTFNGMTTRGAANEIIQMVEDGLREKGVNLEA